jgi:hypothetical protein
LLIKLKQKNAKITMTTNGYLLDKNNNDLYITPDGKISLCRKIEDEIDILVQTKDKNNEELILRLDTALKQMGSSCKY